MELPSALERVLGALLSDHCVTSWKVTSEGQTPTVVLRLKPVSEHQDYVSTHVYRRKPVSQVMRDRRRAAEHKQKLELRNVCTFDASTANPIGQETSLKHLSSDVTDTLSTKENKDSAKVNIHSDKVCSISVQDEINTPTQTRAFSAEPRPPSPVPTARAAGEGHTQVDTSMSGGQGGGSDGGSDEGGGNEGGEDSNGSDTNSDTSETYL